jgi:hypothetical protein
MKSQSQRKGKHQTGKYRATLSNLAGGMFAPFGEFESSVEWRRIEIL